MFGFSVPDLELRDLGWYRWPPTYSHSIAEEIWESDGVVYIMVDGYAQSVEDPTKVIQSAHDLLNAKFLYIRLKGSWPEIGTRIEASACP